MTRKFHLTFGTVTGIAISIAFKIEAFPIFIAGSAVGSLLPDIDTPQSTLGKLVPFISYPINKMFGHRKLLHAPLIYLLIMLLFPKMGVLAKGLLFGCFTHLLLDMFTIRGIPILYPFAKKFHLSLLRIKTGNKGEGIVTGLLTIIFIGILFSATIFA